MKKSVIALALSAAGLMAAVPQIAQAFNAQQVLESISAQGLIAPHDLEKEYGYWSAKATTQDGSRVYVLVNDANGKLETVSKADLGTTFPSAAQVVAHLQTLGYAQVRDLEFDDGFWEAEVRKTAQSPKLELLLHPVTLQVIHQSGNDGTGGTTNPAPSTPNAPSTPSTTLSAAQLIQSLQQGGYSRIHDVEFDDGIWEAEATNSQGQRVDLKLHPQTGAVLREKLDD